ncbi:MAG: hypothetical protein EOP36_15255 [Rubrivivax sp.]|nr:MAG: hypothetical protein EOP36_15255 [Rubrivivax sp.]
MSTSNPKSPPQGDTLPRVKGKSSPRLPHEHDESADSQHTEEPRPEIQQAHADLERGLVDTDRSPVTDEVYHRTRESDKTGGEATKPRP